MTTIQAAAQKIKADLGLNSFVVGVKFILKDEPIHVRGRRLLQHRYCQALMKARQGEHVLLDAEGISCPAAAAAFGFKALPPALQTGKGLQGFGIVANADTGKRMFEGMTALEPGTLQALYLFPLEQAVIISDIVVVEDEIEKLMWIALAHLNNQGGKRIESSTAILQAACVDATLIPFLQNRFNMSFGCYGCRDATDIGANETVLGFPFHEFEAIASAIDFLQNKAIPNSRSKNALEMLKRKDSNNSEQADPLNT
ncbi:MAG TPA: DUF169 domain-containing protein [bacterium]|nr:DUF169 domain-containing protein [bacterium]HNT67011.1 DUF169 domain-containing protein [bacterium]HOX86892.1 DUF169 domain-containing protein [bacterium]HPG46223.1 DUF169 domain-containing protein [bacterium]HPM98583.1 DUF169 domain-containing protein [bacterium]